MKAPALCGAGFLLISATAMAQSDSEALRACNLPSAPALPGAAAKPVPAPSPDTAPSLPVRPAPAPPAPAAPPAPTAASEWIVSETRSPLDYSAVTIATATFDTGTNGVVRLSIECRGGRTEMVIRRATALRMIEDHTVIYRINDAPQAMVTIGTSSSGSGIALKGDAAGFLLARPAEGVITFRVTDRRGPTLEARYDLSSIKTMVDRMARPCNWRRK
ncbi:hypothetical protein SAMN02990966_00704 [Rhodospirillales bacterium URHD0017]|nr:hypothetical protein SAMN02990966_00704 [Rhodospirillales bacterium URHD0017]